MKRLLAICILCLITNIILGQISSLQKRNLKGEVKSIKDEDCIDEFDKNGDRVSRTSYKNGKVTEILKETYKAPGLIFESKTFDASNNQTKTGKYEYDENKNLISYTIIDNSGKVLYKEIRKYSDKSHYISGISNDGKPINFTDTITLDSIGRIVLLAKNYFGTYRKELRSYHSNNFEPSLEQTIDNGKLVFEKINEFNDKGDITKITEKGYGQTQITTYEYNYDKNGNYTKQISKGQYNDTYKREIRYY